MTTSAAISAENSAVPPTSHNCFSDVGYVYKCAWPCEGNCCQFDEQAVAKTK